MRAAEQHVRRAVVARTPVRIQQALDLVEREAQLVLPELAQLAARTPARERQRRVDARCDRRAPMRRHALEQHVEELKDRGIFDAVRVVDDDEPAFELGGHQRVDDFRSDVAPLCVAARQQRDQCVGRGAPGQVVGIERGQQAGGKPGQVVVGIGRDPCERRALRQRAELPRQCGRLPESRRRTDQRQPLAGERRAEVPFEAGARDEIGAQRAAAGSSSAQSARRPASQLLHRASRVPRRMKGCLAMKFGFGPVAVVREGVLSRRSERAKPRAGVRRRCSAAGEWRCGPRPCGARSRGPVAKLAAFATLSTLKLSRRVRGRSALRARATRPALLGAAQARRRTPARGFAGSIASLWKGAVALRRLDACAVPSSSTRHSGARKAVAGRRAQRLCGAEQRSGSWPRAQRASSSDSSRLFERSERSERSEFARGRETRAAQGTWPAGPRTSRS